MFRRLVEEIRFVIESSQQSPNTTRGVSPASKKGVLPTSRGRWTSRAWAEADRINRNTKVRQTPAGDDNGKAPVDSTLPVNIRYPKKFMGGKPLTTKIGSSNTNLDAIRRVANQLADKEKAAAAKEKAAAAKEKAAAAKEKAAAARKAANQGSLKI